MVRFSGPPTRRDERDHPVSDNQSSPVWQRGPDNRVSATILFFVVSGFRTTIFQGRCESAGKGAPRRPIQRTYMKKTIYYRA
jgi:hypothetical protein